MERLVGVAVPVGGSFNVSLSPVEASRVLSGGGLRVVVVSERGSSLVAVPGARASVVVNVWLPGWAGAEELGGLTVSSDCGLPPVALNSSGGGSWWRVERGEGVVRVVFQAFPVSECRVRVSGELMAPVLAPVGAPWLSGGGGQLVGLVWRGVLVDREALVKLEPGGTATVDIPLQELILDPNPLAEAPDTAPASIVIDFNRLLESYGDVEDSPNADYDYPRHPAGLVRFLLENFVRVSSTCPLVPLTANTTEDWNRLAELLYLGNAGFARDKYHTGLPILVKGDPDSCGATPGDTLATVDIPVYLAPGTYIIMAPVTLNDVGDGDEKVAHLVRLQVLAPDGTPLQLQDAYASFSENNSDDNLQVIQRVLHAAFTAQEPGWYKVRLTLEYIGREEPGVNAEYTYMIINRVIITRTPGKTTCTIQTGDIKTHPASLPHTNRTTNGTLTSQATILFSPLVKEADPDNADQNEPYYAIYSTAYGISNRYLEATGTTTYIKSIDGSERPTTIDLNNNSDGRGVRVADGARLTLWYYLLQSADGSVEHEVFLRQGVRSGLAYTLVDSPPGTYDTSTTTMYASVSASVTVLNNGSINQSEQAGMLRVGIYLPEPGEYTVLLYATFASPAGYMLPPELRVPTYLVSNATVSSPLGLSVAPLIMSQSFEGGDERSILYVLNVNAWDRAAVAIDLYPGIPAPLGSGGTATVHLNYVIVARKPPSPTALIGQSTIWAGPVLWALQPLSDTVTASLVRVQDGAVLGTWQWSGYTPVMLSVSNIVDPLEQQGEDASPILPNEAARLFPYWPEALIISPARCP